jgi:hypothetical protein
MINKKSILSTKTYGAKAIMVQTKASEGYKQLTRIGTANSSTKYLMGSESTKSYKATNYAS